MQIDRVVLDHRNRPQPLVHDDVKVAQGFLNWRSLSANDQLVVDGVYGLITIAAVMDFQRINGLEPDGIAGPRTWERLEG